MTDYLWIFGIAVLSLAIVHIFKKTAFKWLNLGKGILPLAAVFLCAALGFLGASTGIFDVIIGHKISLYSGLSSIGLWESTFSLFAKKNINGS